VIFVLGRMFLVFFAYGMFVFGVALWSFYLYVSIVVLRNDALILLPVRWVSVILLSLGMSVSKTGLWWCCACRLLLGSLSWDCRCGIFLWYPCVFLSLRCVVCPFCFSTVPCLLFVSGRWLCYCSRVCVLCGSWWEPPPWLGSVLWIRVSRQNLMAVAPGPVGVCINAYVGLWRRLFLVAGIQGSLGA
jgi:hypothetical protein